MVILLGEVGYPNGDCQAGISAEYTSDGEDLVMGTIGVKQFRGKNNNSHICCDLAFAMCHGLERVIQREATDQIKMQLFNQSGTRRLKHNGFTSLSASVSTVCMVPAVRVGSMFSRA